MNIFFKKYFTLSLIGLLLMAGFLFPLSASAQGLKDAGATLGDMQNQGVTLSGDLSGTANTVVKTIFYLVGTIFLVLVIYGGIVWMKSAGRDAEVARAKRIVATSVIGVVILLLSYAITTFVMGRLTGSSTGTSNGSGTPVDTSSLGCCYSSSESDDGLNHFPSSKSTCEDNGGAYYWSSSQCH
ncbi:MAG: pilin [Patescibacteria group bacterium]